MKSLTALLMLVHFSVGAQDSQTARFVSIELDPAPFLLGGYSVSAKAGVKNVAWMASIFSSWLPNNMMLASNKEMGWTNLKLETSYAIFAEFYRNANKRGFYAGPSLFLYNKSVEYSDTGERIRFSTLYPNVRVGYIWYPFDALGLYAGPWLNVGSELNLDKHNSLHGLTFEPNRFYFIAAAHVGYRFQWK